MKNGCLKENDFQLFLAAKLYLSKYYENEVIEKLQKFKNITISLCLHLGSCRKRVQDFYRLALAHFGRTNDRWNSAPNFSHIFMVKPLENE